ncbi:cold-shock protein [Candidatus Thioglobus sp.]|uniref:cold-shock protein n=1 Tax=Candidatus Thioglobus sp. TaxID=2026721 RepID=UPI003D0DA484
MAKKIKGTVSQFGTKGYGFITGDDDEKYFVHQKNIFNKSRLKANTRVVFVAQESDKGLVAVNVELEGGSKAANTSGSSSTGLSATGVRVALSVLFIAQAVVIYKVFFTTG